MARKVAVSFLSSKHVVEDLMELEITDCDFIHVDVMDGKFVKNKYLPFDCLDDLSSVMRKRLDVHLMVKKPEKFIEQFVGLNTECITIHSELDEVLIRKSFNEIKKYGIKCGLAINPDTDISVLEKYLDYIDQIIVMSVFPGQGGQKFIPETTERIRKIKELIGDRNIVISVDGGVNNETVLLTGGADIVVSGSYITNAEDFQKNIDLLR